MDRLSSPSKSSTPAPRSAKVVEAPTLKEALRQVRARYGEDARVIRSRSLNRRQPGGLGRERVVEVLVEASERTGRLPVAGASATAAAPASLTREIAAEVQRVEDLVRQISVQQAGLDARRRPLQDNPVGEALVTAGADPGVVVRLCERFQAETGRDPRDRSALLQYLSRNLPTGRGGWEAMAGMHAFLGFPGSGRTELLLGAAARLAGLGRQVLVLDLLPRHGGQVRRLQAEAARHGYDAAVIQKPKQLAASAEHLARYEVVLLDAPAMGGRPGRAEEALRRDLIQNPSLHRHLVFPLDRDLRDCGGICEEARAWNCDWLALSRVDQTGLRGKIVDLLDRLPLPISLIGDAEWPEGEPRVADSEFLTDLILTAARRRAAVGA